MNNNRARCAKLWRANPHCHWCGVRTVLCRQPGGRLADNVATLDHLRGRSHPLRLAPGRGPGDVRTVLACFRCNNRRGIEGNPVKRFHRRRPPPPVTPPSTA